MTPVKWLWIAIAAIVTFLIWFGLYYRDIQIPHWSAEGGAKERIVQTGELAKVERIYKHIWDETTWVGYGVNSNEEQAYVYLRSDESTLTVKAADAIAEDELKSRFRSDKPDAELIRIAPGLFRSSPAWEIYYELSVSGERHHYYDFYSFDQEGKLLDSYRLPSKSE
ncbi:hypothetical protein RB620_01945 [Paenibacillus sp. LHD-117]|uniref:hypothetical protein n=1 Tax=Paenibacillus sp. LHD-117 TaxID=3071412 RepID=UPI0027E189B9|nr:hypothetical protein [Paenibacillus sp. LHD-117]MDQ6418189.1 hypothetical protein [Paenibacillus sp. LHD-117]